MKEEKKLEELKEAYEHSVEAFRRFNAEMIRDDGMMVMAFNQPILDVIPASEEMKKWAKEQLKDMEEDVDEKDIVGLGSLK